MGPRAVLSRFGFCVSLSWRKSDQQDDHLVTLADSYHWFDPLEPAFTGKYHVLPDFAGFFMMNFGYYHVLPTVVLFLDFAVFKSESWWSGLLILYSHLGLVTILEIWLGEKRQRHKASMMFICILFLWKISMRKKKRMKKTKNASWTFGKCQPSSQLLFFPQRLQRRVTSEVQDRLVNRLRFWTKDDLAPASLACQMWTSLKSGSGVFFEPKKSLHKT